jgi:threonine/homoserine/homoserine lactone efflux protein
MGVVMTNELLGYIKDFATSVLALAVLFGLALTDEQIAAILLVLTTAGALVLAWNSRRPGGAVQTVRNKALAAEEAGIVPADGPPPAP